MRNILRDWLDDKRIVILSQRRAGMKPGYPKTIIDEIALSFKGTTLTAAQLSITMMCALAASECTEWQ